MTPLLHLLRRPLTDVAALSFALNLLMLVPALFMLQVFDRVLNSHSGDTLAVLLVGAGVALALMGVLDYLRGRLQGVLGAVVAQTLSPTVARITVAQGALRDGRAPTEALRDIATLRQLFSAQGLVALFDAPWALVYVGVIAWAHPLLGAAALAAVVVMLALALLNDALTRRHWRQRQQASTGATRYLEASLQHAEVIHTLGMSEALIGRWQALDAEAAGMQRPSALRGTAMAAATRTVRQGLQVVMMAMAAWLVISGEATAGVMIAVTTLLGRALQPAEQIVGSWRVLAEGHGAYRRLGELLDDAASTPAPMPLPPPTGALEARGLVLRAPHSDRLLLSGVDLNLNPGDHLAIVGASGAGKSTLVRLLTGLWRPTAGTVRLDGADISQWPREALGPWIGYVPQDVELFPATVAENIARLGEVDSAKVVAAAEQAGVHDMILGLPQGYDTRVDPSSALLSPGQRQRIALARALYGSPRLLVLDEPNANLDAAGEAALAHCLKALRGRVTTLVVTHRPGLTAHVDRMIVLDGGRVLANGPTAEVMKALRLHGVVGGPPTAALSPAGGDAVRPAAAAAASPSGRPAVAAARADAPTSPVASATH